MVVVALLGVYVVGLLLCSRAVCSVNVCVCVCMRVKVSDMLCVGVGWVSWRRRR